MIRIWKMVAAVAGIGILCAWVGWSRADGDTAASSPYEDNRPQATLRMEAKDAGVILRHGGGPGDCDSLCARDVWVFADKGKYYMHYDAAGPTGWISALATSGDLYHWKKQGVILDLGKPGSDDAKTASYGTTYFDGNIWQMFYIGSPNAGPPPDRLPMFPYLTLKARGNSPLGPWQKQPEVVPFRPRPDTYYSATASAGFIVKNGDEYLQFFSGSTHDSATRLIRRTIGIARTKDLNGSWTVDPQPIVPLSEQIENTSLYYEKANKTWYLFTNHIGIKDHTEYTDAIWVYWTKDLNKWDTAKKAVVLDPINCSWSHTVIGLPSVVKAGNRLAIFYDGLEGKKISHVGRDVGVAFLPLPLPAPK